MSAEFDPYHKWLGISPRDQPPNHYRLLGIDLFESDPDVISQAADQRMAHLRTFQAGLHSRISQKLWSDSAVARKFLLNDEQKIAFNRSQTSEADCAAHRAVAEARHS